jgi:hypothetical protein
MASTATARVDRKLQLKDLLDWMIEDGHIDAEGAAKLTQEARARPARHPIITVATPSFARRSCRRSRSPPTSSRSGSRAR